METVLRYLPEEQVIVKDILMLNQRVMYHLSTFKQSRKVLLIFRAF